MASPAKHCSFFLTLYLLTASHLQRRPEQGGLQGDILRVSALHPICVPTPTQGTTADEKSGLSVCIVFHSHIRFIQEAGGKEAGIGDSVVGSKIFLVSGRRLSHWEYAFRKAHVLSSVFLKNSEGDGCDPEPQLRGPFL